jgi:hypothetical protein
LGSLGLSPHWGLGHLSVELVLSINIREVGVEGREAQGGGMGEGQMLVEWGIGEDL